MRVFSWPLDEYLFIRRGQDERGFSSLTKERSFNQRFTSTKRFNYGLWCFSKIFGSPKISTSPFLKATSLIKKRGGKQKKIQKALASKFRRKISQHENSLFPIIRSPPKSHETSNKFQFKRADLRVRRKERGAEGQRLVSLVSKKHRGSRI